MVEPDIRAIIEAIIGGAPFEIGQRVPHPDGRLVEIVGGQYWGTDGLSNHWSWRAVMADGSLADMVERGCG